MFQKKQKRGKNQGLEMEGPAAQGLTSGALVKRPILGKALLNTEENANPATWRKRGPLGKGDY